MDSVIVRDPYGDPRVRRRGERMGKALIRADGKVSRTIENGYILQAQRLPTGMVLVTVLDTAAVLFVGHRLIEFPQDVSVGYDYEHGVVLSGAGRFQPGAALSILEEQELETWRAVFAALGSAQSQFLPSLPVNAMGCSHRPDHSAVWSTYVTPTSDPADSDPGLHAYAVMGKASYIQGDKAEVGSELNDANFLNNAGMVINTAFLNTILPGQGYRVESHGLPYYEFGTEKDPFYGQRASTDGVGSITNEQDSQVEITVVERTPTRLVLDYDFAVPITRGPRLIYGSTANNWAGRPPLPGEERRIFRDITGRRSLLVGRARYTVEQSGNGDPTINRTLVHGGLFAMPQSAYTAQFVDGYDSGNVAAPGERFSSISLSRESQAIAFLLRDTGDGAAPDRALYYYDGAANISGVLEDFTAPKLTLRAATMEMGNGVLRDYDAVVSVLGGFYWRPPDWPEDAATPWYTVAHRVRIDQHPDQTVFPGSAYQTRVYRVFDNAVTFATNADQGWVHSGARIGRAGPALEFNELSFFPWFGVILRETEKPGFCVDGSTVYCTVKAQDDDNTEFYAATFDPETAAFTLLGPVCDKQVDGVSAYRVRLSLLQPASANRPAVLAASRYFPAAVDNLVYPEFTGVYLSTDGGLNWEPVADGAVPGGFAFFGSLLGETP